MLGLSDHRLLPLDAAFLEAVPPTGLAANAHEGARRREGGLATSGGIPSKTDRSSASEAQRSQLPLIMAVIAVYVWIPAVSAAKFLR